MTTVDVKFEISEDVKALLPEQKLLAIVQEFAQIDHREDREWGVESGESCGLTK